VSDYITVARAAKTQGRKGEIAADLFTDFPEKFAERRRLFALHPDGSRRELQVEEHWPHKGRMVFKFAGVDSITEAEALLGSELQIPAGERSQLEKGATYISDLVGCTVIDVAGGKRQQIGRVKEVMFGSGEAPTLVIEAGVIEAENRELLVPFAESYLRKMDLEGKSIEMELPEALLELDAPLTEEEKKRQRNAL
jgi:16S rRNA processing protein RimM